MKFHRMKVLLASSALFMLAACMRSVSQQRDEVMEYDYLPPKQLHAEYGDEVCKKELQKICNDLVVEYDYLIPKELNKKVYVKQEILYLVTYCSLDREKITDDGDCTAVCKFQNIAKSLQNCGESPVKITHNAFCELLSENLSIARKCESQNDPGHCLYLSPHLEKLIQDECPQI